MLRFAWTDHAGAPVVRGEMNELIATHCASFPACPGRAPAPAPPARAADAPRHRALRYVGELGAAVAFSEERFLGRENQRIKVWQALLQTVGRDNAEQGARGWQHARFNLSPTMMRHVERLEPRLAHFGYSLLEPRRVLYTAGDPSTDVFAPWGLDASQRSEAGGSSTHSR